MPFPLLDAPQIAKFHSSLSQPIGSVFALFCNALSGSKPFRFQWFKDGEELGGQSSTLLHSARFQVDTKQVFSHLMLHDLVPSDSGNYSCTVSNDFGLHTQWSVLQVKGLFLSYYIEFIVAQCALDNFTNMGRQLCLFPLKFTLNCVQFNCFLSTCNWHQSCVLLTASLVYFWPMLFIGFIMFSFKSFYFTMILMIILWCNCSSQSIGIVCSVLFILRSSFAFFH